jgi:hypothetical protein
MNIAKCRTEICEAVDDILDKYALELDINKCILDISAENSDFIPHEVLSYKITVTIYGTTRDS